MENEYYTIGKQQLIDIMEQNFGTKSTFDFCILNAVKYLFRCNRKHEDPLSDLRKARNYIDKAIDLYLTKYEQPNQD